MIPDRFQYFLDDFGNFENSVKIWTRRPPNCYQNVSKNTRTIMDPSWKNIMYVNMGLRKIRTKREIQEQIWNHPGKYYVCQ